MPCSRRRGNPNWIATDPARGIFLFGQFALTEARRAMDDPQAGVAGMPQPGGAAGRLAAWLSKHSDAPGADFLVAAVDFSFKLRIRCRRVRLMR